jgi:two-component system LytT family sensor kinase
MASQARLRTRWIWFGAATLFALLMFMYDYLDYVARERRIPFYFPFVEEFTGVYGAALLFPLVRWMARRFPLTRRTWTANLLRHAGALLLFSAVHTTWNWVSRILLFQLLELGSYDYGLMSVRYLMELPIDVILYTLFVSGVWLFDRLAAEREAALQAAQLESQLRQAQLQGLRLQLQPHFLFNALNTISSTMYEDPRAADTMLSRLAELLRVSLKTTQAQEVPLATEIESLEHYIALLRARFGDRLLLQIDVEDGLGQALAPSLILQPLIENAVRHGNLSRVGTGRIAVRACAIGERVRVEVQDDGQGPEEGSDVTSKGLGIPATVQRLRLLYGAAQRFELDMVPGTGFVVRMEWPRRDADPARVIASETQTSSSDPGELADAHAHRR